ncbi:hypothetical protein BpHYR1_045310 [Brachionus plicatilis]|uniref:Transmembrane protein n=1 Tax=Brachionus plicatilis TaxID=10195 RepID=A0A3M7SSD2_BRAPC|nr:hypothetical protein BpHYR1_045310 [Brachionus plicatilis]
MQYMLCTTNTQLSLEIKIQKFRIKFSSKTLFKINVRYNAHICNFKKKNYKKNFNGMNSTLLNFLRKTLQQFRICIFMQNTNIAKCENIILNLKLGIRIIFSHLAIFVFYINMHIRNCCRVLRRKLSSTLDLKINNFRMMMMIMLSWYSLR